MNTFNREWYEKSYRDAWYNKVYDAPTPLWAAVANRFHVHQVIAWLGLSPKTDKVLDLGSGVGRYMDAWEEAGFTVQGVEHSQTAIDMSKRLNILCTDIGDLSAFQDREFAVAFSAATLEHIAEGEATANAVREMARTAKALAHYIPVVDHGNDPSHVHIQSAEEWVSELSSILGPRYVHCVLPNLIEETQPLFLSMRDDEVPFSISWQKQPLWRAKA